MNGTVCRMPATGRHAYDTVQDTATHLTERNPLTLRATTLATLVALAAPAAAQEVTIFHTTGGTGWNNPTKGLTVFSLGDVETRNLVVEKRPWPSTVEFGAGPGYRCAYKQGDATDLVGFHNANGRYTGGQPIAVACTYRGKPKCSRTATIRGVSYTANRGSMSCEAVEEGRNPEDGPAQQGSDNVVSETYTPFTGIFTVRIYGKVCLNGTVGGAPRCSQFGPGGERVTAGQWLSHLNQNGYRATFAPGKNCGPARWPTPEMRSRQRLPYAEWCDFTIDAR